MQHPLVHADCRSPPQDGVLSSSSSSSNPANAGRHPASMARVFGGPRRLGHQAVASSSVPVTASASPTPV
ncbi:hypothetical protein B2J93_4689 [Marssonina coronariae]|uniref:Uncharacterized protein n=1 Tax=Diplocarpon coronariae TaxID=2795749 RepID=A0A218Z1B6_9HELO|nr:hypothetical protein B2J93_4689 [Marssonina coronariae]